VLLIAPDGARLASFSGPEFDWAAGLEIATVSVQDDDPPATEDVAWVTGFTPGTPRNDVGGWRGMRLKTGPEAVTVTALGRVFITGNAQNHNLVLVDKSTGATVASALWTPGGGVHNQIKHVDLAAPVTLAANTEYYLATQETSGGDYYYSFDTTVTTTSAASVLNAVYNTRSTWTSVSTPIANKTYGPVGIKYAGPVLATTANMESLKQPEVHGSPATVRARPEEPPVLVVTASAPGSLRLSVLGVPGWTYWIEFTESLNRSDWRTLVEATTNDSGRFDVQDTLPAGSAARFYRAVHP
jgi:hypothetical protein